MTMNTTRPGFNLTEKYTNCLQVPLPPLVVAFTNSLTAEEESVLTGLGFSVFGKKDGKSYSINGEKVTPDILSKVYRHKKKVKTTCQKPFAAANLSDYQGLFKVMGIVTWFLKTHTYPAFQGPVGDNDDAGGSYDAIDGLIGAKRKGTFGDRNGKRLRMEEGAPEDEDDVEMTVDHDVPVLIEYKIGTGDEAIPKAKPSTIPAQIYGSPSEIPTLPGLVFPYFDDILADDMNFVSSVIRSYFLDSLGDTRDDILAGYHALKGSMGSIGATKCGKILQHLFCGIKLAIESQAKLFPIIQDNKYLGFTLHGWYFTVAIDGYKHRPLEYVELIKEVRRIDEHAVAVAEILGMLTKMKLSTTRKPPTKKYLSDRKEKCLSNPRELALLLAEFDLGDEDQVMEIEKSANRLAYPQRFYDVTAEKVLESIDLLINRSFPGPDVPMYTRGGVLTSRDPVLSVLSAFGYEAFSFKNPGGAPRKVPQDPTDDTLFAAYKGKGGKMVNPNPAIIMAKKSLSLCVEDWKAFISDHLYLHKSTRDSAYRCWVIGGPKAKELWSGIITRVGKLEITSKDIRADDVDLGTETVDDPDDDFLDFL